MASAKARDAKGGHAARRAGRTALWRAASVAGFVAAALYFAPPAALAGPGGLSGAAMPIGAPPPLSPGPRAGDVFVRDASGRWVPERGGTAARGPAGAAIGATPGAAVAVSEAYVPLAAFAAAQGLVVTDHGTFAMLEQGPVRMRLYPNSTQGVVSGRPLVFRQAVRHSGGEWTLPTGVAGLLAREAGLARATAQQSADRIQALRDRALAAAQATPKAAPIKRAAPEAERARTTRRDADSARPTAARTSCARPLAGWVPSTAEVRDWRWIVLHHSDDLTGNAAKYDRVHRVDNGWEHGLGYHFVIGNGSLSGDGEVEVGGRWQKQLHGAHAKTPDNHYNDHGVGICLVGAFDKGSGRPTPAQMDSMVRLIRWLMATYDIPLEKVIGHCHCCTTACPGKNFPWDELKARLR